jgi:hypothetical protein
VCARRVSRGARVERHSLRQRRHLLRRRREALELLLERRVGRVCATEQTRDELYRTLPADDLLVRGAPARDSRGGRVRVAGVAIIRLSFSSRVVFGIAFGGRAGETGETTGGWDLSTRARASRRGERTCESCRRVLASRPHRFARRERGAPGEIDFDFDERELARTRRE